MKSVTIVASSFFQLLKERDTSMWEILSQLVDGEEKEIVFVDDKKLPLFNYILPATIEKLKEDQKIFAKEFQEKIRQNN